MKVLLLAVLSLSFSAQAAVPSINAREVTCAELQGFLAQNETIRVKFRVLGVPMSMKVHAYPECFATQYADDAKFKTLDTKDCYAGAVCRSVNGNGEVGGGPN